MPSPPLPPTPKHLTGNPEYSKKTPIDTWTPVDVSDLRDRRFHDHDHGHDHA